MTAMGNDVKHHQLMLPDSEEAQQRGSTDAIQREPYEDTETGNRGGTKFPSERTAAAAAAALA